MLSDSVPTEIFRIPRFFNRFGRVSIGRFSHPTGAILSGSIQLYGFSFRFARIFSTEIVHPPRLRSDHRVSSPDREQSRDSVESHRSITDSGRRVYLILVFRFFFGSNPLIDSIFLDRFTPTGWWTMLTERFHSRLLFPWPDWEQSPDGLGSGFREIPKRRCSPDLVGIPGPVYTLDLEQSSESAKAVKG
jgi:hypothetical protein